MRNQMSLVLVLASAGFLSVGCAPENAQDLREIRPTTVGLLGAAYRPNGTSAFGGAIGYAKNDRPVAWMDSEEENDERDLEIKKRSNLNAFYHYYPFASSAFFVGAALEANKLQLEYQERTTAYAANNKSLTKIDYESSGLWAGVPIGWAWIWDNGFTLILDFGPRFRFSHDKNFNDDGLDQSVSISRRDDLIDDLDKSFKFGGAGIIGYSF